MTPHEDGLQAQINEMLADAGHEDDPALRRALESIGSLALLPAPEPSGELAAMLAGPGDDLARRRRSGRHRPTVIGLAVIAGMGLGIGGVAASAGVKAPGSTATSVQHLLGNWSPDWTITQGRASGQTSGSSRPAPGAGELSDMSAAAAGGELPTSIPAGTPAGVLAGNEGAWIVGPTGKTGCGNQGRAGTTPLAGSCPPADGPSRKSGGTGNDVGGNSPVGNAEPVATPEEPSGRGPGRADSGLVEPGADQPGRATGNGGLPRRAGIEQVTDPGYAKPGQGNSRQGEPGEGLNSSPGK